MLLSELKKYGIGLVLLGVCLASVRAEPHDQSLLPSGKTKNLAIIAVDYSEPWFVFHLARLQSWGDFAGQGQMGQLGLKFHPKSVAIRLALAHGAMSAGRCDWALSYLNTLDDLVVGETYRDMARGIASVCLGGWRQRAFIAGNATRQKSLLGALPERKFEPEQGSPLYSICLLFDASCANSVFRTIGHGPTSGTDIWVGVSMDSWKLFLNGARAVSFGLFRRMPTRSEFGGTHVAVGYWHSWQRVANRLIAVSIAANTNHLARGPRLKAESTSQIDLRITRHHRTGPNLYRFASYEKGLPWRWRLQSRLSLDHSIVMAAQQSHSLTMISYGWSVPLADYNLDLSVRLGHKLPARRTPRQMGSTISGGRAVIQGPSDWPVAISLELDVQTQKYDKRLFHLASAHSDRIRNLGLSLSRIFGASDQLEIGILAKNHKVSSRNTLAEKSKKSVTIYFNYKFQD